ncbi:hypothetical protein F383_19623 [Gossypium arboreum]|jgi:hypothetical protein
MVSL